MRRFLAILMIAPLSGCGAHLHRPFDEQLALGAAEHVEALDWDEAFANDRAQRDAIAEREAELGREYAEARREAELLDVLTEPVGEQSWRELEGYFVALAACMLDEPGTGGGRACRGRVSEAQREVARALLFDPCPAEGCAWVDAVIELHDASTKLADRLAAYDRARGLAGLGDAVASAAQCPLPTRLPARLRAEGQALEQACDAYDDALAAVAKALPNASGLRAAIEDYRALARVRDDYRRELRLLVAELGSLRFDGRFDRRDLELDIAHYLELQAKYALGLAGAKSSRPGHRADFGDLLLEGTLMITREHRAAIIRTLAVLGAVTGEIVVDELEPEDQPIADSFRGSDGSMAADPGQPPEPEPEPEPEPDPTPPRPRPTADPTPPRPVPESPERPEGPKEDPPAAKTLARRAELTVDAELVRSLGASLVPVFGETWRQLEEQRRTHQRGSLLLSAELERIQIDAMTRRLAHAEERIWLKLALIETQLLALLRLRGGLEADWIPAQRPPTAERDELARLELDHQLAEAALERARDQLDEAIASSDGKSSKTAIPHRQVIEQAKQRVREAQTAVDQAADAHHEYVRRHGATLCVRQGGVSQTYERDFACVAPIERLVGLHAELVGASLPRLEQLDRAEARRRDEAALLRDQAGLEIRITYIAASVAALQRFTEGGLEPGDVAAIVGAVVGIGLGAAITAGVYMP